MVDFNALANTAQRLISQNGRIVTFRKLGTAAGDPEMPWRGPEDARVPVAQSLPVPMAFVSPAGGGGQLGLSMELDGLVRRSQQTGFVAGTDVNPIDFDEVVDTDGSVWKIESVARLQPAGQVLLYAVGLNQ